MIRLDILVTHSNAIGLTILMLPLIWSHVPAAGRRTVDELKRTGAMYAKRTLPKSY